MRQSKLSGGSLWVLQLSPGTYKPVETKGSKRPPGSISACYGVSILRFSFNLFKATHLSSVYNLYFYCYTVSSLMAKTLSRMFLYLSQHFCIQQALNILEYWGPKKKLLWLQGFLQIGLSTVLPSIMCLNTCFWVIFPLIVLDSVLLKRQTRQSIKFQSLR